MTATIETRYRGTKHIRQEDAEPIAKELEQLAQRRNDHIRPEDVVEAARAPQSAMHRYFEWDDSTAAALFRVNQARGLLRSIEVKVVIKDEPEPRYVRQYHNVVTTRRRAEESEDVPEDSSERAYVPLSVVSSTEHYLRQVINNAARELHGWRDRYRTYQGLAEFRGRFGCVIEAIERVERAAD